MNNKKLKRDKNGNLIVPIVKGHLMIPVKNKEYKILYNLSVDLFKKDFKAIQGKWDDLFKGKLNRYTLGIFLYYLPEVIYNKLKKDYKKEFNDVDLVKIAHLTMMKGIFKKNEYSFAVMLDLLKEVK